MNELEKLSDIILSEGAHSERGRELCVMEAVAYIAGEPHSDRPQCACPIITRFMIEWNDGLPTNDDRERLLKPLIPLIVGTRATPAVEMERSEMALDWLLREHTPTWLEAAGLKEEAAAIRENPSLENFKQAFAKIVTAGDTVWDAALDAVLDAEQESAKYAALAAARDAAWLVALQMELDVALAVALNAALFAVGKVALEAQDTTQAALQPIVLKLQESAVDLVKKMCAAKE